MSRKYILLLVAIFTLYTLHFTLFPIPYVHAYPPAAPTVSVGRFIGRVTNRTQGGIAVPGLEVFLEKFVNQNLTEKVKTLNDREGYFQFPDLPVGPENSYRISLKFQGVDYAGHPFAFREGETLKTMEMVVYDATGNPDKIKTNIKHIIMDIEESVLKVTEAARLENSGNTTYQGPLHFSLPKGFEGLKYERGLMSCCVDTKESGFLENMPFYPGFKEVTYSYQLKSDSSHYLFPVAIDYPLESLDVMIRDVGIKLESKRLTFISALEMGDKKYLRLSARGLLPGENIEVKISGLPLGPERYRTFVLLFAGLIILLGIAYPFLRKKPAVVSVEQRGESVEAIQPEEREKELLGEIAELDDLYAQGGIEPKRYEKLRERKKKSLILLILEEKEKNKNASN